MSSAFVMPITTTMSTSSYPRTTLTRRSVSPVNTTPPHLSPSTSSVELSERRPPPSPPSTPTPTRPARHSELLRLHNENDDNNDDVTSSLSSNPIDSETTTETATIKIVRRKKGGLKKSLSVDSSSSSAPPLSHSPSSAGTAELTSPPVVPRKFPSSNSPSSSSLANSSSKSYGTGNSVQKASPSFPSVLFDSEALKVAFGLFDQNCDGRVSLREVESLLYQMEGRLCNGIVMDAQTIQFAIESFLNDATSSSSPTSPSRFATRSKGTALNGYDDDEEDENQVSMSYCQFLEWLPSLVSKATSLALMSTATATSPQLKSSRKATSTSQTAPKENGHVSSTSSSGTNSNRSSSLPTEQQLREEEEKDLRAAFALFDEDGNGYISKEELKTALRLLREDASDIDSLLRAVDVDRDGLISVEDFLALFK